MKEGAGVGRLPPGSSPPRSGRRSCRTGSAVDQERIDAFAEVTEDEQFIHVDPERAEVTALRGNDGARVPDVVDALGDGL